MNLRSQLVEMEGFRNIAYPDPLTGGAPWTIGVGHTGPEVFEGLVWADSKVQQVFEDDLNAVIRGVLFSWPWVARLSEPRQAVFFNMAFQMGLGGLSKFKEFLRHAEDERFPQAAGEMLDSKWARQTPKRARRLARQMETGDWQ